MKRLSALVLVSIILGATVATAGNWFTVAEYQDLKARDLKTTHLVLRAMREAVFYGQKSMDGPVICASPTPIDGAHLVDLVDKELGNPTNIAKKAYAPEHQLAYVLIHALRRTGACQ